MSSDSVSKFVKDEHFADLTDNEELKEKHQIYLMGLMAIAAHYWNGNKKGVEGDYPLNCQRGESGYNPNSYLGHNIAAIAVNGDGEIIDFDFNHNEVFDSSVEHAESRLLRRIFSLTQVYRTYNNDRCAPCNGEAPKQYDSSKSYGNVYKVPFTLR
jgi:hypothetical protein